MVWNGHGGLGREPFKILFKILFKALYIIGCLFKPQGPLMNTVVDVFSAFIAKSRQLSQAKPDLRLREVPAVYAVLFERVCFMQKGVQSWMNMKKF